MARRTWLTADPFVVALYKILCYSLATYVAYGYSVVLTFTITFPPPPEHGHAAAAASLAARRTHAALSGPKRAPAPHGVASTTTAAAVVAGG